MRYMCRWILKDAFPDAELIEFEDGRAAWEHLQSHSVDVLVTDHSMPHMNGADLTRMLRAHGHQTPVIMISSSVVNIREAMEAGVSEFLEKDHLLDRLPAAVERFLPKCAHVNEPHEHV
jgi:DNA-binding NtrC family response regulator